MARVTIQTLCSICGKENGQVICQGCSKVFCVNHFNSHRQELDGQLDEIEVTRDLFRQLLTEKVSDPNKHSLIEWINQWENDSINKIRQVAEENRQILFRHTTKITKILEDKLNKLTDQLRKQRENSAFSEIDLDNWKEQLKLLKTELENPSSIAIREQSTPLVVNINIEVSEEKPNTKSDRTTQTPVGDTSNAEQFVSCTICDEKHLVSAIGTHLITCGNKTDQCPMCGKYIRRAVFHYHYENNCGDIDEIDTSTRNASTHQSNNVLQFPLASESSRLTDQVDNMVTIPCEICQESIPWSSFEEHTRTCVERGQQRRQFQATSISDQHKSLAAVCKYCGKEGEVSILVYHENICEQNPNRQHL